MTDTEMTELQSDDMMLSALENLWRTPGQEGAYVVRHGREAVRDFVSLESMIPMSLTNIG